MMRNILIAAALTIGLAACGPQGAPTAQSEPKDRIDRVADTDRIIKFSTIANFGYPFQNEYFHFTLYSPNATPPASGTQYVLIFNDLDFLAIEYQAALEVKIVAPESDVLNVDLKGENVMRNIDYLNELGNTYLKFGLDQKNQSAINTLNFFDRNNPINEPMGRATVNLAAKGRKPE